MTKEQRVALITKYSDNSASIDNYKDLGIFHFAKDNLGEFFTSEFAPLHYEMIQVFFDSMRGKYERRIDKQRYFLCHREAAKSTIASFLLPLYCIFMKDFYIKLPDGEKVLINEKFIVITSETSSQATDFVNDIKSVIDTNKRLPVIFSEKSPQYIITDDERSSDRGKWTRGAFITSDGTAVMALGSGQRIRGRKIRGSRPTLIVVDDMYSEENTKTEEAIEKLNKWFFNALINSLDSIEGKTLWVGTLVHPDIVYKKFVKSENWIGVSKPIISPDELKLALSYCKTPKGLKLPDKQVTDKLTSEFKTLSWKRRHDVRYILMLYLEKLADDNLNYFYQEYMNESFSPDNIIVTENTFYQTEIKYKNEDGLNLIEYEYKGIKFSGNCTLIAGVDVASSLTKSADDTVIIVGGYARVFPREKGKEFGMQEVGNGIIVPVILEILGGKYDIRESQRPGISETLQMLSKKYKLDKIMMEANGQQELAIREIRKDFYDKNNMTLIQAEYVTMEKQERILAVLLPIIQKYKYFICTNEPILWKLYNQLLVLPLKSSHDDYPDALEKVFKSARLPQIHKAYTSKETTNQQYNDLSWYFN